MCGKIYQKSIVIVHFHCLKTTIERMSYQNIFRNKFRIDFYFFLNKSFLRKMV